MQIESIISIQMDNVHVMIIFNKCYNKRLERCSINSNELANSDWTLEEIVIIDRSDVFLHS